MSEPIFDAVPDRTELTRRSLLGGLTAAAGAVGLATVAGAGSVSAGGVPPAGEALLDPAIGGLTYVTLDAFAFDVAGTSGTQRRLYQEITGMQPLLPSDFIYASLPIPIGSVVKQINIAYQGQPIVSIGQRSLGGVFSFLTTPVTLAGGAGAKTQTLPVSAELVAGASYSMRVFCAAGDSILGMTIGYAAPANGFIPYAGTALPRVFDSRVAANAPKFAVNETRVIDLSTRLNPAFRAAVLNLTATEPTAAGFLAAFQDGIAYPGNSSVNFAANQTIANGVIVTMVGGKIKVLCSAASSHVIVDVIGALA
jgi:hypothetical protein